MARCQSFWPAASHFLIVLEGTKSIPGEAARAPAPHACSANPLLTYSTRDESQVQGMDDRQSRPFLTKAEIGLAQGMCFWLPRCECVVEMRKTYSHWAGPR